MHIFLLEIDNCPSWISRRGRITVEMIWWSISMQLCGWAGIQTWDPGSAVHTVEKYEKKFWIISFLHLRIVLSGPWHITNRYMSQGKTKPTRRPVWPAKDQHIHPVLQGFSFIPLWIAQGCRRHMRSAKTLIRLHGCAGRSIFTGHTSFIVGFVVRWLIYYPCNVLPRNFRRHAIFNPSPAEPG